MYRNLELKHGFAKERPQSKFKINTDKILDVPDACPICGHQLAGNESICLKCGHCVICQRPQHSRSVPDSQLLYWRP